MKENEAIKNAKNALSNLFIEVKNYDFKNPKKAIVTNNIDAVDAKGQMSHIWVASMIHKNGRGKGVRYSAFNDASMPMQEIWGITHFILV
ncbi:MAG: hypothetical protein RLY43_1981 [Bacteroidota bacterium]|jgi:hypothetical protein